MEARRVSMKKITMGDEYMAQYEGRVLAEKKANIARVWPMPGAVILETALPDDELTPDQAEELSRLLAKAAEDARHLHDTDDPDGVTLADDRP
jgi:hypothetical protein